MCIDDKQTKSKFITPLSIYLRNEFALQSELTRHLLRYMLVLDVVCTSQTDSTDINKLHKIRTTTAAKRSCQDLGIKFRRSFLNVLVIIYV